MASGRVGIRQAIAAPRRLASVSTLLGLLLCACGCSMLRSGTENLVWNPWEFPHNHSLHRMEKTNQKQATGAWRHVQSTEISVASSDFAAGFQDGYADYLTYGGDGRPPLLAPRRYWRQSRFCPAREAAQYEWFAGFEQGVRSADLSGERQQLTASVGSVANTDVSVPSTMLHVESEMNSKNEVEPEAQSSGLSRMWGTLRRSPLPGLKKEPVAPEPESKPMDQESSEVIDGEFE